MKRIFLLFVLAAVIVLPLQSAFAASDVTVGIKAWQSEWTEDESGVDPASALLVGPNIKVKMDNNVFFGLSVMTAVSDYDFGYGFTADRNDLDLLVGYSFNETFYGFLGYKTITSTWTVSGMGDVLDLTITAPLIGVGAGAPVGDGSWVISGNIAVGTYTATYDWDPSTGFPEEEYEDNLTSIEFNVTYIASEQAFVSVGYKQQNFEPYDTFSGPTLGVDYRF